jgi:hypothetical protein
VGNDHQDSFFFPVQIEEHLAHCRSGVPIQIAGGLIGKYEGGALDEGAGDGHALALAAGQFRGPVIKPPGQPNPSEKLPGPNLVLGTVVRSNQSRDQNVFQYRALRQEVVVLKNEADMTVAEIRQGRLGKLKWVSTVKADSAGSGSVQRAQNVEESTLARPRRTHDCQGFAASKLETHIAQN